MKDVLKSIVLGILFVIGIICLVKGLTGKDHVDQNIIQSRIDSLQRHSDSLSRYISETEKKVDKLETKIDSLESLKPKIVIKYVKKYKEIDSASVGVIIADFDSIFAANGHK